MAVKCLACSTGEGKYKLPGKENIFYCSVKCYKALKEDNSKSGNIAAQAETQEDQITDTADRGALSKPRPLKRLRDLQWPNEPDPSLWDDPLNQHEVKPLRNQEYEAIATSPELRALMAKKPELCDLLKSIFTSTSSETPEQKLLGLLGMSEITPHVQKLASRGSSSRGSQRGRGQARGRGRGARGGHQQSSQQQGKPDKDEKALMEEFSATINSILKETRSNTVPT